MNSGLDQPQRFEAFIHQCVTAALKQIEDMDANHLILAGHSEKTGSLASLDEHIQCMLMFHAYDLHATIHYMVQAFFNDRHWSYIVKQAHTSNMEECASYSCLILLCIHCDLYQAFKSLF